MKERVKLMADKIVYYNEYCKSCKHKNLPETEEPCDTCLENPVNEDSHRPVMWEEGKKVKRE